MLMAEPCVHYWTWSPTTTMCRSKIGPSITMKANIGSGYNQHHHHHHHIKKLSFSTDASKDSNSNDSFGFYPWDSSFIDGDAGIEWVPEDRVTLLTSQGLVQIGGSLIPRSIPSAHHKKRAKSKSPRQESDYMDPNQQLCLGALFHIAATNGLDLGRRLCIFGFCRSVEMLRDVVQDTVLEHGGEIRGLLQSFTLQLRSLLQRAYKRHKFILFLANYEASRLQRPFSYMITHQIVTAEKASRGGLQEKLSMIVAVPLLWGVPPASETLHVAVRTGGGIVEKVYWQWDFL